MPKPVRIISIVFLGIILSFCLWLGYIAAFHYTVPVLMYHYIDEAESRKSRLGVSPRAFERQMRFLREHKYNIVPLEELVGLMKEKKRLPYKTIAIAFDDGYLNNFTRAFPILKKYNIPATIFIIIDRVGKRLGHDDYMDWRQIEELSKSGIVSIGSHSMSHLNLSEVQSEDKMRYEIFESKRVLEEKLKAPVSLFSYPFGGLNLKARGYVIEAGYKGAAATNLKKGYPSDDAYAIKRLRISENAGNMFVFWVETSGLYTYIKEMRDKD